MTQLVWLVTGCSSGFGTAFVHEILARGDKVIATGRNAETKLAHLENTGAAILDLDVTLPQADLDAKIQEAIKSMARLTGSSTMQDILRWDSSKN
jgi:NAD(P)-dependent dehydrogenase (short-subunit alcohol dehydrogenase family)